jgi:hypothetical protein
MWLFGTRRRSRTGCLTKNVVVGSLCTDMMTKRFWGPAFDDRRGVKREAVDFYAIELLNGARYLRRICNVSGSGLLIEDRLTVQKPGAIVHLELPRPEGEPIKVDAQVVRVIRGGVGVRALGGTSLEGLGGTIDL